MFRKSLLTVLVAGAASIALPALRIPVKWATDSGGCGPASESQTQAKVMMREVDHFSQEKCGEEQHHFVSIISFCIISFRFGFR